MIALTFDDGPSESTPKLLDLLERYRVRATFFQCGVHAERLPEIAREVSAAGHEIGNHTYSHAPLYLRSGSFIGSEVSRAQEVLTSVTGVRPRVFRATYGARWFGLRRAQEQNGLMGVMWTVMGLDWKLRGVEVARRLVERASNGGILCLHDGRERGIRPDISATIEGVEQAVPELGRRGYRFLTVSELLCLKN